MIRLRHLTVRNFKRLREIDLAFPPSGSILIEGLNESGKSTLFEAIYFALYGRALVTEGGLESTIRYGCHESFVELSLEVDATTLLIQRRTRAQGQNRGKLLVRLPDGTEEEVARARAMNERIVAELGKLDGDTLLNSCFVEQKKLQRLESLDAASRRESLLRLLNLDNLTALENQFKVSRQDDRDFAVAQVRLELATVRDEIPVRQCELAQTERQVTARHVRSALDRRTAATANLVEVERTIARLEEETAALDSRLARIAAFGEVARQAEAAGRTAEQRQRLAEEVEARQQDLDALDRLADEERPHLVARRAALTALAARLRHLETVEHGLAGLDEGRANASAASEADAEVARHEADRATLATRLRRLADLREAGQAAERLAERLSQQAALTTERDRLEGALSDLRNVRDGLPDRRAHAAALNDAANSLDAARQQYDSAERQIGLVADLAAAETALEVATGERSDAERRLRDTAAQLIAARQALQVARSARSPALRPLIVAWSDARATIDDGDAAASARDDASRRLEWARQGLRQAESLRSATVQRSTLGLAVGGVGLLVGILLAALGLLVPGGAVALVSLTGLGVGIRERGRLTASAEAVSKFGQAVDLAQQGLADATARLSLTDAARVRLAEAERALLSVGERVPSSVDEARDRLRVAEQRDRAAEASAARERDLDETVSRLTREEGQAQGRCQSAVQAAERCTERVSAARVALGGPADDSATLHAEAARHLEQAKQALKAAQERAASLDVEPTAERVRQRAAVAQASVSQDEQQAAGIAPIEARAVEAGQRLDALAANMVNERRALDAHLTAMGQSPLGEADAAALTALGRRIAAHLGGEDATALERQRSQIEAAIGAARQRAEQRREDARDVWQRVAEAARALAEGAAGEDAAGRDSTALLQRAEGALASGEVDTGGLREDTAARRRALAAEAERVDAPLTLDGLRDAVTVLEARWRQIEDQLRTRPSVVERRDTASAQVAMLDRRLAGEWAAIGGRLATLDATRHATRDATPDVTPDAEHTPSQAGPSSPVLDVTPDASSSMALTPATESRDAASLVASLHAARVALDEDGTRARRDAALGDAADARARAGALRADQQQADEAIAGQLRTLGLMPLAEPTPDALCLVLPEIDDPALPDLDVLESERRRLDGIIGGLDAERQRLEGQWGLAGADLDTAACRAELERLTREKAIKLRATRIVQQARSNLIGRVLPSTEHNLRLLLPQVTTQRYRDATLSDEYRLQVWDADAGRYVAKEIFSGGTKDQFSLALRLAFALATLPQELGTTPGFIFLDEPLSAFDQPRTAALVELLTTGQIAKSFAQIFLISHSRAFDPDLFPYYLRMHEGRVAETNLSSPVALAS
ncbi:MAG: AAA family ATPase [Chloroflexi bacterium]|nr:AAA family ATPase [Chloroflexota bacterium]